MKTFVTIYFKSKEDAEVNINLVKDFFVGIVGYTKVTKRNNYSFVFDDGEEVSFKELASSINYDLMIPVKLFKGKAFCDEEKLNEYIEMVDKVDFSNYSNLYFSEEDLIINNLGDKELIKRSIFKKYYDTNLIEEIKVYLDQNMNISKASEILYMHRNTMMNKIDKFIEISGYDIKKFRDAFIIYHLLY